MDRKYYENGADFPVRVFPNPEGAYSYSRAFITIPSNNYGGRYSLFQVYAAQGTGNSRFGEK